MSEQPVAVRSPLHREALVRTGALAGWAARPRDPQVLTVEQCDAISEAAVAAVLQRLAEWEQQDAAE